MTYDSSDLNGWAGFLDNGEEMNRVNSNELLMSLAKNWPDAQIDGYIKELEEKRDEMADVIRDLKSMIKARNKKGRKLLDNGPRGGV